MEKDFVRADDVAKNTWLLEIVSVPNNAQTTQGARRARAFDTTGDYPKTLSFATIGG